MKQLLDFILEYKGHAPHNSEQSIGDPDEIKHYFKQGYIRLKFTEDIAYAFVYNKEKNIAVFADKNQTHNMLFRDKQHANTLKEMGLEDVKYVNQIRYCCGLDDDTDAIDAWYEENKKYVDSTICGRIWYNAQQNLEIWDEEDQERYGSMFDDIKDIDATKLYIANWNEIQPSEFQKTNDNIVNNFCKKHNIKIKSYIAIDNNGIPHEIELGKGNIKVDKRTELGKEHFETAAKEHADIGYRALKRQHMQKWISGRNGTLQKKYNKEYKDGEIEHPIAAAHNHKYQMRYNPYTKKMERGEHLGDSFIDNEKNKIDE